MGDGGGGAGVGVLPQAGVGDHTCPKDGSDSSMMVMVHVVSVIPYPSITRAPKQLEGEKERKRERETPTSTHMPKNIWCLKLHKSTTLP